MSLVPGVLVNFNQLQFARCLLFAVCVFFMHAFLHFIVCPFIHIILFLIFLRLQNVVFQIFFKKGSMELGSYMHFWSHVKTEKPTNMSHGKRIQLYKEEQNKGSMVITVGTLFVGSCIRVTMYLVHRTKSKEKELPDNEHLILNRSAHVQLLKHKRLH
jgi:hypothetical protein